MNRPGSESSLFRVDLSGGQQQRGQGEVFVLDGLIRVVVVADQSVRMRPGPAGAAQVGPPLRVEGERFEADLEELLAGEGLCQGRSRTEAEGSRSL